jgi:FkbM family methyltransferase
MNRSYEALIEPRHENIDGIADWRWVAADQGAWNGPKNDWVTSHKVKYMEHVRKFDVVVQAGGNCGMYPRLFAQYFKWVYTFEPDPVNFMALVLNCQIDNVVKMQAALGNNRSMVELHRHNLSNVGMHKVKESAIARIPQLRIDDLSLGDCDLIQLDVEEYELQVLLGGIETIKKFKPVIAVENSTADIQKLLYKIGYETASSSHMDTVYRPKL